MGPTQRIELSDGHWAEIRTRLTVADLKYQRQKARERGYDDEALDGLALLPRVVTSWSYGEVDEDTADGVPIEDATAILQAATPVGEASSTSSSAGGNSKKGNRPSNG